MKSIKRRLLLLFVVFVAAVAVYMGLEMRKTETNDTVYTGIEEATFPLVWAQTAGREMNVMYPYTSQVGINAFFDSLTLLSDERQLELIVKGGSEVVKAISYEVRSASLEDLIENNEITDFTSKDKEVDMVIPISNLITKGNEYRLNVKLTFASGKEAHYYTRIAFGDQSMAGEMIALADDFSSKNLNSDQARDNSKYLETDQAADHSRLGEINLKADYESLAYHKMALEPVGDEDIRLLNFTGDMGEVELRRMVKRELGDGDNELYEIKENFTIKKGTQRLYMMDYNRQMTQVIKGVQSDINSTRVNVGITMPEKTAVLASADGNTMAFVADRDLFVVDGKNKVIKKIYSFRGEDDYSLQDNYDKHAIKILSCDNDGNVEFVVYGYMNRGGHEGALGISLNQYRAQDNSVNEHSFIPVNLSYEEIKEGMQKLSYLGENNMFYVQIADAVYGIDINSNDYTLVASGLVDYSYCVSPLGKRLAWQEGNREDGEKIIHFMNLDTGDKKEVRAEGDQNIRPEGFIDLDLIVGISKDSMSWNVNGMQKEVPCFAINIVDDDLRVQKHYERQGQYLTGIRTNEGRIHVDLLNQTGENTFEKVGEDTIVSTVQLEAQKNTKMVAYSDDRGTVYGLQFDHRYPSEDYKIEKPEKVSFDTSGKINLTIDKQNEKFVAIVHGGVVGSFDTASDAINRAYANMGSVRKKGKIVYLRAGTANTRNLKVPAEMAQSFLTARKEGKLLDLQGITLKESLYFVSQEIPVLTYSDGGAAIIIYGYDQTNISIYDIASQSTMKLGIGDAEKMFERSYNDFSCFFTFS